MILNLPWNVYARGSCQFFFINWSLLWSKDWSSYSAVSKTSSCWQLPAIMKTSLLHISISCSDTSDVVVQSTDFDEISSTPSTTEKSTFKSHISSSEEISPISVSVFFKVVGCQNYFLHRKIHFLLPLQVNPQALGNLLTGLV